MTDLLADRQTKTDALSVERTLLLLNLSKQIEQLGLILVLDPKSVILDIDLDEAFLIFDQNLSSYLDFSPFLGELESVRHEVESDLLQSIRVNINVWIIEPL